MESGIADRVDERRVGQAAGAGASPLCRDGHTVGEGEALGVLPVVVGLVGDGREVAEVDVVGGDGRLGRLGHVEDLPDLGVAGCIGVLDVVEDDVGFDLVDAGEDLDALDADWLVAARDRVGGVSVGAEHAVGGAGRPWHLGDVHGGRGREFAAGHVDGGGDGVHDGLGQDLPPGCRLSDLRVSSVGARADGNIGADVDVLRVGRLDERSGDVGFGLADGDLPVASEVSAEGVLDVAVGVFEHVHELDVPGVGHGLAAPALAFLRGLIDAAVLRAEGGGRLLAGEGVRDAGAVAPCAVFGEQHARAEGSVWEHGTGHGHEAVVLDAAVAEGHVLGVELQPVEARGGHDERVAMRAVGGPCAGLVLDGRDERIAGVVDASVDVPHAEGRKGAVVVAAAHGVGGRDDGQSGVVVEFHALRAVGRGPEREPDGIDVRIRVGREVFRKIGHTAGGGVVVER